MGFQLQFPSEWVIHNISNSCYYLSNILEANQLHFVPSWTYIFINWSLYLKSISLNSSCWNFAHISRSISTATFFRYLVFSVHHQIILLKSLPSTKFCKPPFMMFAIFIIILYLCGVYLCSYSRY